MPHVFIGCGWWRLQVRNVRGEWREVAMGRGIKALVLLNLQSYAGGRDLWGLRDPARDAKKGWRTPIFNDGLIEVGPACLGMRFYVRVFTVNCTLCSSLSLSYT